MAGHAPNIRRQSMLGTVLLGFGYIAAVASLVIGHTLLAGVAVVLLLPGGILLRHVGRSLR